MIIYDDATVLLKKNVQSLAKIKLLIE